MRRVRPRPAQAILPIPTFPDRAAAAAAAGAAHPSGTAARGAIFCPFRMIDVYANVKIC